MLVACVNSIASFRIYRPAVGSAALYLLGLWGCQYGDTHGKAAAGTDSGVPTMAVILPASEARTLLTSCDGVMARADSLWIPSTTELQAFDKRLAEHINAGSKNVTRNEPWPEYSRQYLGLFRDGRKLVFVQGVHRSYLGHTVAQDTLRGVPKPEAIARLRQWFRTSATNVCDGGKAFFRAEYDVSADRISSFAFNSYGG